MVTEASLYQLLSEIVLNYLILSFGIGLIIVTKKGRNILLDPPEPFLTWKSRSTLTRLLGRRGEAYAYYILGGLLILVAGILIIQRLIILAHRLGY